MGLPGPMRFHSDAQASALQSLINDAGASHDPAQQERHHLALQVAHNLRHQHGWTNLRMHHSSSNSMIQESTQRPLISGLPPQRLYVHPDEQIELLQQQKNEGKTGMPELTSEREWVLPTHLREKWSLSRFGEIFDRITIVPNQEDGEGILFQTQVDGSSLGRDTGLASDGLPNPWRTAKRILLATLDEDSTVVYYLVHDGIVKPRQN